MSTAKERAAIQAAVEALNTIGVGDGERAHVRADTIIVDELLAVIAPEVQVAYNDLAERVDKASFWAFA